MSTMNLAPEIFEAIEGEVGHDRALRVAKSVDAVVVRLEEKAREHSFARKVEIKDELKQEMRDELATKADLADVRTEMANMRTELKGDIAATKADLAEVRTELKGDIASLKLRMTIQFLVTIFVIVLMNQQALPVLGKMLGLLK